MNGKHYDAIVIGGGTMGSAVAWDLGKRGLSGLVLERFQHFHDKGAHHGDTRVFRHAYAESPDYVPLVRRADTLWQELEAESGNEILVRCGGLELSAPGFPHARAARASADEHGIPYEWLTPEEARRRWPMVSVPDGWDVLFSDRAGFTRTEPALRSMMAGAVARGIELRQHEPATGWGAEPGGVWVQTAEGRHTADMLFITSGAWSSRVMADLGLPLTVLRKVLWWLGVERPADYAPERFPVFIADYEGAGVYGFPMIDERGMKIANHDGGDLTTIEEIDRTARREEGATPRAAAKLLFPGVNSEDVRHSAVCTYTMTPDTHFVVDRHPEHANVLIGAGFSGHGFKFAPAIGEFLVDLAVDPTARPLPILALDRFALAV